MLLGRIFMTLSGHSYHSCLPAGLLNNILCLCRDHVDKFLLVFQHLLICVHDSS